MARLASVRLVCTEPGREIRYTFFSAIGGFTASFTGSMGPPCHAPSAFSNVATASLGVMSPTKLAISPDGTKYFL